MCCLSFQHAFEDTKMSSMPTVNSDHWLNGGKKGETHFINTLKFRFCDKTGNDWSDRRNFEKIPRKYDLVEIDYATNDDQKEEAGASDAVANGNGETKSEKVVPESKLDIRIQVTYRLYMFRLY